MAVFIKLWPCLFTSKLSCSNEVTLQKVMNIMMMMKSIMTMKNMVGFPCKKFREDMGPYFWDQVLGPIFGINSRDQLLGQIFGTDF